MASSASGAVLADITNAVTGINIKDPDDIQRSRDAGWAEPSKYDYDSYKKEPATREERENSTANQNLPQWAANAAKYEWSDEYGDVGPRHQELEELLFHDEFINRTGNEFEKLTGISVTIESAKRIEPVIRFEDAGLHPVMLENVKLCQYKVPTPIQAYCIPSVLKGNDIIGIAQTGSGKTAAYLIPTVSKFMGKAKKLAAARPNLTRPFNPVTDGVRAEPLILIISPTRELATQIFDEARRLCYRSMLRPCVAYGGAPIRDQVDELKKGCDILIGTPGRLIDFMQRSHVLTLRRVKYTIIDEADEMVSDAWLDEMEKLAGGGDTNEDADHVYMMFSATFAKRERSVAKRYMSKDHIRIRVGRAGSVHVNVKQSVIFAEEASKRSCLYDLLMAMPPSRTIIFVNGKKSADFLDDFLYNKGLPSTSIHSDRTQREREDALRAFKLGKAPILVATGVSARGLDIKNVMHVINYDLPNGDHGGIQEYVHRIGRTARIGNIGLATSLYNERNEDIAGDLVRLLLENNQGVPDFLERFKPEDVTKLEWDDDSDELENDDTNNADADAWNDSVPIAKPASSGIAEGTWGGGDDANASGAW